uniref:glycoside hydrolase family 5 protein n=1 Tax=Altererythrobacter segetis TaxID=1104773 RepID=UPI001FAF423B|nr:glycoside hydrolase family 5 protein [Altererythrobacter segetis]
MSAVAACGGGGSGTPAPSPAPSPSPTPVPTPTPAGLYPSYNTSPIAADIAGMSSTAVDIAGRIKAGWNIGNTLEAIGGETAWGNPLISKAYVDFVKASGFDAVRLPAAWDQYANQTTAKIDDAWLDRIKTVIQYCVDAGLYVLLNIHWDGGWLENNVSVDKQDAVAAKQKAFWEQIATHLRDFDEHLMFASANEPNCDTAEKMEVLYRYHQTFIDAVRSTGGKNAYRVLVVQAPNTNIALAGSLWNRMPTDTASNRLMVEVHYYEPFQFTQLQEDASWGRMFYYWGKDNHSTTDPTRNADWGEEDFVDQQMAIMKSQFTDKGIPVVLGEYLASVRKNLTGDAATLNQKSVTYWMKYVTEKAVANGLLPFVWDTGGAIDRRNPAITDPVEINTVLQATGKK